MVVKMEWVKRANRDLIFRATAIDILVNVGSVMIDHDYDAMRLDGITCASVRAGLFQELAEARNLFNTEFMAVRLLKERSLRTNDEGELSVSMRLRSAELLNQFNYLAPAQIARQLAVQKAPM